MPMTFGAARIGRHDLRENRLECLTVKAAVVVLVDIDAGFVTPMRQALADQLHLMPLGIIGDLAIGDDPGQRRLPR